MSDLMAETLPEIPHWKLKSPLLKTVLFNPKKYPTTKIIITNYDK